MQLRTEVFFPERQCHLCWLMKRSSSWPQPPDQRGGISELLGAGQRICVLGEEVLYQKLDLEDYTRTMIARSPKDHPQRTWPRLSFSHGVVLAEETQVGHTSHHRLQSGDLPLAQVRTSSSLLHLAWSPRTWYWHQYIFHTGDNEDWTHMQCCTPIISMNICHWT